ALAAQVTVALEVSRNLLMSEQHRRRAESLTRLALEVNSLVRGPEFAAKFLERAAGMMEAADAALVVENGSDLRTSVLHSLTEGRGEQKRLELRFGRAVIAALSSVPETIVNIAPAALLGDDLAGQI